MAEEMIEELKTAADNLKNIEADYKKAQKLINALSEAGEDTTQLKQNLRTLEVRKVKWQTMLKNNGYDAGL